MNVEDRLGKVEEKLGKVAEDVAFIKGKMEKAEVVDERKVTYKSGLLVALIGAGSALVTEIVKFFALK